VSKETYTSDGERDRAPESEGGEGERPDELSYPPTHARAL
jgi:hypothetical protein